MRVRLLNVYWGTAVTIVTSDGRVTLIDGGDGRQQPGQDSPEHWLVRSGHSTVDCLILTHVHRDHLRGLLDVARRFPVKRAILPYAPFAAPQLTVAEQSAFILGDSPDSFNGQYELLLDYLELIRICEEAGSDLSYVDKGAANLVWEDDGFTLERLYPEETSTLTALPVIHDAIALERTAGDEERFAAALSEFSALSNFDSAVYLLKRPASPGVLFSGDQVGEVWRRIASSADINGCIWVLPHHGASDGVTEDASAIVSPAVGIASISGAGASEYRAHWADLSEKHAFPIVSTSDVPLGTEKAIAVAGLDLAIGSH